MPLARPSRNRIPSLLGAMLLLGFTGVSVCHGLDIRIEKQATVRGETIHLEDIAAFEPGGAEAAAELRSVEVASAPAPGGTVRLNKRFLEYKIGSALGGRQDVNLHVPNTLSVTREAQLVKAPQLERIFKDHILVRSDWPEEDLRIERFNVPESVALPQGALDWEITDRRDADCLGNVGVIVSFRVDGEEIRRVPLSAKVSVEQEVVKAARRIPSGELIGEDDLMVTKDLISRPLANRLTGPDRAVGKRTVRSIREGQAITARMLEDPPLVEKGKRVLIRAENEIIRVSTLGKVLEEGRAGDQVRVLNVGSGNVVVATVVGPGIVEVVF